MKPPLNIVVVFFGYQKRQKKDFFLGFSSSQGAYIQWIL